MTEHRAARALLLAGVGLACLLARRTDAQSPEWLRLEPPLVVSDEGFRGVMWCTPLADVPWERDPAFTYPTALFVRRAEDLSVFGQQARSITYTLRNSVLYGVRIDIDGRDQVRAAALEDDAGQDAL